jgi:hypothetical protein
MRCTPGESSGAATAPPGGTRRSDTGAPPSRATWAISIVSFAPGRNASSSSVRSRTVGASVATASASRGMSARVCARDRAAAAVSRRLASSSAAI